ncbi:MAG: hypothetical protein H0V31_10510 [Acidobacteria bacterium]|nr:hypothetical protein [Acidobacteriota bacterium]
MEDIDCDYAIVSFSQKLAHKELSQYLMERNLSADSFLWIGGVNNILPSINKMVLPSHILVDRQGEVIKTFPGTDKEKSVRERMANQIVNEIKEISHNLRKIK